MVQGSGLEGERESWGGGGGQGEGGGGLPGHREADGGDLGHGVGLSSEHRLEDTAVTGHLQPTKPSF